MTPPGGRALIAIMAALITPDTIAQGIEAAVRVWIDNGFTGKEIETWGRRAWNRAHRANQTAQRRRNQMTKPAAMPATPPGSSPS